MDTLSHPCVDIHTTPAPQPSIPPWFADTVLIAGYLRGHGLLGALSNQVRLVRKRFGQYEVLDFVALLFGYAISGERTLQAFFDRFQPFAIPFMALFERGTLPHRSTLSRFLAAVDTSCLEALRSLFLQASLSWGWTQETIGGLWDRSGQRYLVFDIDGTREAARQRKLPTSAELPLAQRRLDGVCRPGYMGHRRGEVVRTRTTVLQMHTRQWLGSFGGRGNGDYRGELQAGLTAVTLYLTAWELPVTSGIVRVDGQYGDSAVIAEIVASGLQIVVRKRGYRLLDHPRIQAVLAQEPTARITTRESQVTYEVFDLPQMVLEDGTTSVRLLLTRRAWKRGEPISVGKVVGDWVYEHFVTTLPPDGFLATDVLDLYQGRGAFEGTLADEDREGDPDRWCSLSAPGQELWQIGWQWVWNLRLALSAGSEAPLRQMEWAPPSTGPTQRLAEPAPQEEPEYGPLEWARAWGGRLGAEAFPLQADGMLLCPHGIRLWPSEMRQVNAFTQRLICVAKDADCAPCPLRVACLGRTASGKRGRRVSAVRHRRISQVIVHPRPAVADAAIWWNDVAGRQLRRSWMTHWRQQTVTLGALPASLSPPVRPPRAARSHRRLSWPERLGRNARGPFLVTSIQVTGVPRQVLALLTPQEYAQSSLCISASHTLWPPGPE
jgi:hypothetical protein